MNDQAIIFQRDIATGSIAFSSLVEDNSFWNEQGVKGGDIIKEINGKKLTFQNEQQIFTEVYMWQPGTNIEVKLDREGQEIMIKTVTTQSYAKGQKLLVDESASTKQNQLRNVWLKGL